MEQNHVSDEIWRVSYALIIKWCMGIICPSMHKMKMAMNVSYADALFVMKTLQGDIGNLHQCTRNSGRAKFLHD